MIDDYREKVEKEINILLNYTKECDFEKSGGYIHHLIRYAKLFGLYCLLYDFEDLEKAKVQTKLAIAEDFENKFTNVNKRVFTHDENGRQEFSLNEYWQSLITKMQ